MTASSTGPRAWINSQRLRETEDGAYVEREIDLSLAR
jgi:hypothetical protein